MRKRGSSLNGIGEQKTMEIVLLSHIVHVCIIKHLPNHVPSFCVACIPTLIHVSGKF
jgi:hypothetical protein